MSYLFFKAKTQHSIQCFLNQILYVYCKGMCVIKGVQIYFFVVLQQWIQFFCFL